MGVVHHSNYLKYFELARIEWLDSLEISYKWMEEKGVMLPVHKVVIDYIKPARFDDLLEIEVSLRKIPTVRIVFDYVIHNKDRDCLLYTSPSPRDQRGSRMPSSA